LEKSPWIDNSNTIWLASTVTLIRNIEKFKFPGKLDTERRKQMIALVSKDLLTMEGMQKAQLLNAEDMSPLDKEFLVEHYFAMNNFQQALQGEAFIIDNSGQFFAMLNIKDHIRLHVLECKGDLESGWNQLVKLETGIGKSIIYSFSPRFGFLTADPMECGTGLIVNTFMQVPALIHTGKLAEVLDKIYDDAITYTGLQGVPNEYTGDILNLRNNYTLGVNEENLIASVRSFSTKLAAGETAARQAIREQESAEIKDKVSRAFAVLIHSYQIDTVEALNAISLVKLGVDFGWVEGTNSAKLNNLFFNCRRAHLLSHYEATMNMEEIPHRRAEFIHKALKDVKLMI
jgi:protein arginine kinase